VHQLVEAGCQSRGGDSPNGMRHCRFPNS
jgi:hypothetical protein